MRDCERLTRVYEIQYVIMEYENNVELMRKWREKKEEKKKVLKKKYEKNKVKIFQMYVEKKFKMVEQKRIRALFYRGCRNGVVIVIVKILSVERVRKFRQKKVVEKEGEERRKRFSKERFKRYRDKKRVGVFIG